MKQPFSSPFVLLISCGRFGMVLLACMMAHTSAQTFDPKVWNDLDWRSIGPAAMGGRISGIAGVPGNPRLLYAATGSGGLFKTINGGITWQPLFEGPATISIGDIAIDEKHSDTVWVGTGEANLRNSVSFGSGMYYSGDGGKTWEHRGLDATMTIVSLDPRDARRVFVAAVGHPFGPNPERGVYFSPDAGHTWQLVLHTDDIHGASDLDIDPSSPDVIFAGLWRFDRKPWRYDSGDEGGGLYKSSDGGKNWRKITRGLPALMGRIGVKVAPSDSRIVYAIAETREGTLFRSDDGDESFHTVSSNRALVARGYYYCDLRVDPKNPDRVYVLENTIQVSEDGGKSFESIGRSVHGDIQALWIDPADPSRMWQGSDGGLAFSWDMGNTWEHIASISLGQFYHVYADNRKPFYYVSGGTQDNGTWIGPSRTREPAGILNDEWRMVSSIVGFNVLSDASDPDILLTQTPGGTILRTNIRSRDQQSVGPQVRSYNGSTAAAMQYRFAWDAPLVRSPHGQNTFYYGSNVIFQSSDKGGTWEAISHDLTNADPSKWQPSGGPILTDNSSSEVYGTVTRISESPVKRGVIWAGTDDGNVQVTLNGGGQWINVASNIHDVAAKSPVSAIETSHRAANTVYVAFDRHMLDDMRPYLFKTSDGGKTWKKIVEGLSPDAFVWVVREDPRNADVLYLGTEVGLFTSFDAGAHWERFNLKSLPNVAVRDVFVQAQQNDILLATHGRGLWILDDATAVQQMAAAVSKAVYLFPIRPALRYALRATQSGGGDTEFAGPNPPYGALLNYYLREPVDEVRMAMLDGDGNTVRLLTGGRVPHDAGFHRVLWDLRASPPTGMAAGGGRGGRGGGGGGEGGGGRGGGAARGPQVLPGVYTVRLTAGSTSVDQRVKVEMDPELTVTADELKAQWDSLAIIAKLKGSVSDMLREADRHTDSPQWQHLRAQLARPRDPAAAPGLSEQLQSLYNLMDGPNDPPTPAMTKYLAELEAGYRKAEAEFKALQH